MHLNRLEQEELSSLVIGKHSDNSMCKTLKDCKIHIKIHWWEWGRHLITGFCVLVFKSRKSMPFWTSLVTSLFAAVSEPEPEQQSVLCAMHLNIWRKKKLKQVMFSRNERIRVIRFIVSKTVGEKNPDAFYLKSKLTGKL